MTVYKTLIDTFLEVLKDEDKNLNIPLGISNRHVHLSQAHVELLFGSGYQLTKLKDLLQPGQYACKETVLIGGPRGVIEKVRVLGPARKETQVEILSGDCYKLGVNAPIRQSGDIEATPGVTIIGSKGTVVLEKGAFIAQRHIHMSPQDAAFHNVVNNQIVRLKFAGERGGIFDNTVIRVDENFKLECHLDTEEANAMGLTSKSEVSIIKE